MSADSEEKNLVPESKIQDIINKNDIVAVIGRYVELNQSGTNIKGLCPFHSEKTASFTVNSEEKLFYCFGCDLGGDVIKFIQEIESLGFRDALEFLEGGKIETVIVQKKDKSVQKKSRNVQKKGRSVQVIPLDHDTALQKFSTETVLKMCHGVFNGFGEKALSGDSEDFRKFKDISWFPYYDENKLIDLMVVRFEDHHNKKEVLTFYWNGKNVAMKSYPVRIYGRCELSRVPELPVLIHEGEKCVNLASDKLFDFVHITWNGGGKKFIKPDWSVLKDREVFLLPDDDQKINPKTGKLFKPELQPGAKTMNDLKRLLFVDHEIKSTIIPFFLKSREIKPDGADIEEILQCYTPQEITKTILDLRGNHGQETGTTETNDNQSRNIRRGKVNGTTDSNSNNIRGDNGSKLGIAKNGVFTGQQPNINNDGFSNQNNGVGDGIEIESDKRIRKNERVFDNRSNHIHDGSHISVGDSDVNNNDYPFKILGIADNGKAYFLNYENRLLYYDLESLNQQKLMNLAGLTFFKSMGVHKKDDWDQEIDAIMHISNRLDFDIEKLRGRGAWKDNDGNICYHDGKKTTGKFDSSWTFIRKPQKPIGIFSEVCESNIRKEIMEISKNFSFSTSADCIRLLSWAVLAPFSGALTWRPAFLLTGESGTGKSTLIDHLVRKISLSLAVNGGSTTEAAIRQYCGTDSGSTIVDEAESKSMRDRERVEGQFSLMRASTTDDSPKTLKGSSSGVATPFEMRQMFGFVAVQASIDNVADDNRIIRINLKQTNNYLLYVESLEKLKKLLTVKNCNGIRAFTWNNLKKIIKLSERLEFIIQNATGQSARYASGESILLAANIIVWENQTDELDNSFLFDYVKYFYTDQTQEDSRDETEEMIINILDHTVLVDIKSQGKISMSFRELLRDMKQYLDIKSGIFLTGIDAIGMGMYRDYKRITENSGLSVHRKTRELAIANNHKEIKKILSLGAGYHRQLERHKNMILKKENTNIDGTTKRCTIIKGFLDLKNED